ncbi:hypothetical protein CG747_20875 [Streptomyces sp. CB02959]|nr:hypothetical protein CG747_20875 [Streptomyces sp. CB02959]
MTAPTQYSQEPVELPIDGWLYGVRLAPECGVCAALKAELDEALSDRNLKKAYEVSREIRSHPSGHRKGRR